MKNQETKKEEVKKYHDWKKTADIANRYGKDGWISTLKNAIDILLSEEHQKVDKEWWEKIEKKKKPEPLGWGDDIYNQALEDLLKN